MFNKYDRVMMDTAVIWSDMSVCVRGKVGVVIARDNRIISVGYNGTITGTKNECEDKIVSCVNCNIDIKVSDFIEEVHKPNKLSIKCNCGITHHYDRDVLEENSYSKTNDLTLHAEQNALMFAAKNGISLFGATIYVTKSPCKDCSKLIAQSGIAKVIYREEHHDMEGLALLQHIGIDIKKLKEEKVD